MTSQAFARHAARAVPRYTSYPTAPHFKPGFPGATYRSWLERSDPSVPISLYLHVPFCQQMCWYCGCNMKLAARYAPVAAYVTALKKEIALVAEALPARMKVGHLAWGGGTPTALEPADLASVMELLRARFDIGPDAEVAIESDPRTLSHEMARDIGRLGFTRASFGVQEFDPKVQEAINRIQPPETVARAGQWLREAGVGAINFDLIYGLPYQTTESLVRTAELSHGMGADRIALFGYAHVPWMAKNQRMIAEDSLPGAAARAEQAGAAAETLCSLGYERIGLDHFARPDDALAVAQREGRLRRNFQGYTTDTAETLIGFGATSIGRSPWGFVQNIPETGAWARAVHDGVLPVARGLVFAGEDRLRGHVIEQLMCNFTVDLDEAARLHGSAPGWYEAALPALATLEQDGLVQREGARLCITEAGRGLSRVVAAVFDTYLAQSEARHSVAV